jgi:hypothetical protein
MSMTYNEAIDYWRKRAEDAEKELGILRIQDARDYDTVFDKGYEAGMEAGLHLGHEDY